MVRGDAALQAGEPFGVAEHRQVRLGDVPGAPLGDLGDHGDLVRRGEPHPGVQALPDGGLAACPAEDEGDGREQPRAVQPVDDLRPARRPEAHRPPGAPGRPGRGLPRRPVLPPGQPQQLRVHLGPALPVRARILRRPVPAGPCPVAGSRLEEQVVEPAAGQHVLPQRNRPVLVHDHRGAAADLGQPVAELLGVAHRRGQRDHPDRLGQVDDHFFPDRAAETVGQVVDLIQHHVGQAGQGRRAGVEHVAQHLGGHDDHRRLAVDAVVAGEQPHLVGAVAPGEVVVLLVGQRLDRRGVEAFAALGQRQVHGKFPDNGLTGAGRRGHEHAVAAGQRLARTPLEVVEREVVQPLERGQLGPVLAPLPESGIALRRASRR